MRFEVVILLCSIVIACNVQNCQTCVDGNLNKCLTCNDGFFVSQTGLCVEKSKFIGCETFGSVGCDKCEEGYVKVSNFVCIECHNFFTNCNECSSTECTSCANGYELKDANTNLANVTKVCGGTMSLILTAIMVVIILL